MTPLADGALALRGDVAFALVPPTTGSPRRELAWLQGVLRDESGEVRREVAAFGGRWPAAAFISYSGEYARTGVDVQMQRWQADRWTELVLPAGPKYHNTFYSAYAAGPDGAVLGLRTEALVNTGALTMAAEAKLKASFRKIRARVDRLDSDAPPAWPALPAGPVGTGLLGFADGTLVVMRSGPVLQRWTPGAARWQTLPDPGYKASGYYDSPTLVGRDPASIYLFTCTDAAISVTYLHRLVADKWQPIATPNGECVYSLSEASDGVLWAVSSSGLHRRPAPGPDPALVPAWEPVTLPDLQLPARARAWRHDPTSEEWTEHPAAPTDTRTPRPGSVLALGPGELWIGANLEGSRFPNGERTIVLTTRPIAAPIVLPDSERIDLEISGLGDVPVTATSDCYHPLLELGAPTDAPALARPTALADSLPGGLQIVSMAADDRYDIGALWLTLAPRPDQAFAQLTTLADRLRPSFPQARLRCHTPIIVDILP